MVNNYKSIEREDTSDRERGGEKTLGTDTKLGNKKGQYFNVLNQTLEL